MSIAAYRTEVLAPLEAGKIVTVFQLAKSACGHRECGPAMCFARMTPSDPEAYAEMAAGLTDEERVRVLLRLQMRARETMRRKGQEPLVP